MATRDYIPRTDAELIPWLTNYKLKLQEVTTQLMLPMQPDDNLHYEIDLFIQSIHNTTTKKEEWSRSVADKNDQGAKLLAKIRAKTNLIKASSGYTEGMGQELGIIGTTTKVDVVNYKPLLKVELIAGVVRISFKKNNTDGVNIYRRRKGSLTWEFLARDTVSPYEDRIQLQNPGQPEHWEYRAIAVIKDQEIGQPSDVVEIVIGA